MFPRCSKNLSAFQCWLWELPKGAAAPSSGLPRWEHAQLRFSQLIRRCFLVAKWGNWNLQFNKQCPILGCQSAFLTPLRCPRDAVPLHISFCSACISLQEGRIWVYCCFCSKEMVLSLPGRFSATAACVFWLWVLIKLGYQVVSESFLCCVFASNSSGSSGSQPSSHSLVTG